jgi:nitroimidazol reductase NimA-like FMN-containing flavoprotein (pyridoxamine 5'-phosphate oxidase superfamily)
MEAAERDEFLGDGGTGVLSLATGEDPPHTVPVSYGYDVTAETFYFRLAAGSDGAKGELADRSVTFVTYEKGAEKWQSVVAKGRLEDVEAEGIETETLAGLDRVEIPLIDLFERPLREVTFEFYRLVPEEFTGRVEA